MTPLVEPIKDVLKKLLNAQSINLPKVKPEDLSWEKPIWYKDNEYCIYHRHKGYDTNKCNQLKNIIQRLIDDGQVLKGNPVAQPNRNLDFFQNPLPKHNNNVNHVSSVLGFSMH